MDNDREVSSFKDIAEHLNKQFALVFTSKPYVHLPCRLLYDIPKPKPFIQLLSPVVQIWLEGLDLKNSANPDNLHPRLLKELLKEVLISLCNIFQLLLDFRKVPIDWKLTHVIPIFKEVDCTRAENYRPIIFTSVVGKTFEQIVSSEVLTHLLTNSILSPHQHGFQPGKLVKTKFIKTCNIITDNLDKEYPRRLDFVGPG